MAVELLSVLIVLGILRPLFVVPVDSFSATTLLAPRFRAVGDSYGDHLCPKGRRFSPLMSSSSDNDAENVGLTDDPPFIEHILFIECGFGNDSHGQSATKAAVRACRNAIEFNSVPSVDRLVPGGYDALKLSVLLAVPPKYQDGLDLDAVAKVFPYGTTKFTIQDGGMVAPSGIAIEALGDVNDDMVVVCASVTVGY